MTVLSSDSINNHYAERVCMAEALGFDCKSYLEEWRVALDKFHNDGKLEVKVTGMHWEVL